MSMQPDPELFARLISTETGLPLSGSVVRNGKQQQFELVPAGHEASQSFRLKAVLGWRSLEVSFQPGAYAGGLLAAMHNASPESRGIFETVIAAAVRDGGSVKLVVDGSNFVPPDPAVWASNWNSFTASLSCGQLDVNTGDDAADFRVLTRWTGLLAAAIFALLPLEAETSYDESEIAGFPEGAKTVVTVNRYERDRRNRAAALAIHGYRCRGCERLMGEEYGDIAATLIEIHHLTPVHTLGANYLINPKIDLVPLCPNCHAVAHIRNPPLSIEEIQNHYARRQGTGTR